MDKKRVSVIVFVAGILTLIVGVIILLINLLGKPPVQDGEFLLEIGVWEKADDSSVIWNFKELGSGTLTTNNHLNDYDFLWSIQDGKLKIETSWLYTLNNEYDYEINQSQKTLTLLSDEREIVFIPAQIEEIKEIEETEEIEETN